MPNQGMKQHRVKPDVLKRELVAESRLFKVEAVHLRFENGAERVYERMAGGHRGGVMLVPLLGDDTLLLVREYAAGTHSYELGFPKGLIDAGETAPEAGNRELMEETGYGARQLLALKTLNLVPEFFASSMTVLLARDLYPELREGDEPEPLELVTWPLSRAQELLSAPDFNNARSVAALLLALGYLQAQAAGEPPA